MLKSLSQNKKGNSGNALLAWIIIFGLIGLVGSIFGLIQSSVEDEIVENTLQSVSTSQNELTVTDAGVSLTECSGFEDASISSLSAINATGGETISSGNYTYSNCVLSATASSDYNNTEWNVTYSFKYYDKYSSYAYNNSQDAQEAQGKIFGKLGLVATVVILSLVLMLVLGIVAYFNNRNGGQLG